MTMSPESRQSVTDAPEAAGSINPPSGDFEAISDAPTASDAETIAELRRLLAESERQRQVLTMRFARLAWEAGGDPTVVRIARAEEAAE